MATIQKRIAMDGTISFRAMVRRRGMPSLSATFREYHHAREWSEKSEAEITLNRHGLIPKCTQPMSAIFDRYIKEVLSHKAMSDPARWRLVHWWSTQLGSIQLSDVSPSVITRLKVKLATEPGKNGKLRSGSTVIHYLAALSHVFTVCIKEWHLIRDNPVARVSKPKSSRARVRFLSDSERARLIDECRKSPNSDLLLIVTLAIATGMRQGEICRLKRDSVDFSNSCIILTDTKNGDYRRVSLSNPALSMLRTKCAEVRDKRLVFGSLLNPNKPAYFRRSFKTALRRAEILNFTFHDLRHCTASYLAMNGASPSEIAEVLGHKSLQMVKRYAHLSHSHVAHILTKMNDRVFADLGCQAEFDPISTEVSYSTIPGNGIKSL